MKGEHNSPIKVLLVDDERDFVDTLAERLVMRSMDASVRYDGTHALEGLAEVQPEIMVLDLRMPGMDGIEVLHQVKQSGVDVEVIILTGHGTEEDREKCLSLGAFAYLHKPVEFSRLCKTIQNAHAAWREKRAV
ncbi:MAG: response regulator [Desulfovibrionales bacterium]